MNQTINVPAIHGQATPNPFATRGDQVAVLIDFENVSNVGCNTIRRIVNSLAETETVAVLRGYGDWRRFPKARQELVKAGVQLMDLPYNSVGKNGADMQLTVDAMELAVLSPSIGKFVIMAGDRDFVSVAQTLRKWGCQVWGYGTEFGSSQWLRTACNRFEIMKPAESPHEGAKRTKRKPQCQETKPVNLSVQKANPKQTTEGRMLSTEFVAQVAWAIRAVQMVNSSLQFGTDPRDLTSDASQRSIPMTRLFQMLRLMDTTFSVARYISVRKRSNVKLVEHLQASGVLELVTSSQTNQHTIRPTALTTDHQNPLYRPLTYFAAIDESISQRSYAGKYRSYSRIPTQSIVDDMKADSTVAV